MMQITKHYTVTGKVQEVGYRDYVKKTADTLGLMGIANHGTTDDAVTVIAQGDENVFAEFECALRFGPVMAFVKLVGAKRVATTAYYRSFQVEGNVLSTELTAALKKVYQEVQERPVLN